MRVAMVLGSGLAMTACAEERIELVGTVKESRELDAPAAGGLEVRLVDPFRGTVIDTSVSGADGGFSLSSTPGITAAIEVRGEGYAATTFVIVVGSGQESELSQSVFPVSLDELDAERALFEGCPGAESAVASFGEVRIFDLVDPYTGENAITTAGRVDVREFAGDEETGVRWDACYLANEGDAYDPTAEFTGLSSRFAVFGMTPGLHEMHVRYQPLPGDWLGRAHPIWIPDSDEPIAVPQWPAWVPGP